MLVFGGVSLSELWVDVVSDTDIHVHVRTSNSHVCACVDSCLCLCCVCTWCTYSVCMHGITFIALP